MYLNAFRIRLALMAAGVLVGILYMLMTGGAGLGKGSAIIIHFGMEPEVFEGCEVIIDDIPAGTLTRVGATFQNGFKVKPGEHIVRLVHPEYDCVPTRVTTVAGSMGAMLRLDFRSSYNANQQEELKICFEGGRDLLTAK